MSFVTPSALVNVILKACDKAAKRLLRDFSEVEHLQVSRKGPADFVTHADIRTESILKEELLKARPNFAFFSEEGAENPSGDAAVGRFIVDPIDGTTNFMHGIPHFAISVGAEEEGVLVAGVVYDVVKQEIFWAHKGMGAFCNNRRLRVSTRDKLPDCLLATGIPFAGHGDAGQFMGNIQKLMPQLAGMRRMGSAALDMAYVAAGRLEVYWEPNIHHWDIAAGIVLVEEAGGKATLSRTPTQSSPKTDILASNGLVHKKIEQLLA